MLGFCNQWNQRCLDQVPGHKTGHTVSLNTTIHNREIMRSHNKRFVLGGIVAVAVLAIAALTLRQWSFERHWEASEDGLTEVEVTAALGDPAWRGKIDIQGAGGKSVTCWRYERGRWTYSVDYDYTGPNGSLEVLGSERFTGSGSGNGLPGGRGDQRRQKHEGLGFDSNQIDPDCWALRTLAEKL